MYYTYEHSCFHILHYTWLRYIKSCTEDLNHGFFANRWLVHNCFMGFGNTLKVVVHHFLIGGMASLSYRDGFPMVSALVCMVTHWTKPIVSHDFRLSSSHDLTKLLHCVASQPWDNIEFVLKLLWPTSEIISWSYIPYRLGHCWWKLVAIGILNRGTMLSLGIEIVCPLGWS